MNVNAVFADPIEFVMQEFAPFNYMKSNVPSGPAVEIIAETCKSLKKKCIFKKLPWSRAQQQTKAGKHEGIFTVGWNSDRNKWLYYTNPLMETEYGFFELKGAKGEIKQYKELSSLEGKTVIVYGPSNTSKRLKKLQAKAKSKGIKFNIEQSNQNSVSIKKLVGKRGDLLFSNRDVGFALMNEKEKGQINYIGAAYPPYHYYIGFSKAKAGNDKLFKAFNTAYTKLIESGKAKAILDKYGQTYGNMEKGLQKTHK